MLQGKLQWKFRNNYIVNLNFIRIGLYFLMISCQNKWIIRVSSVFIITLRNEKKVQFKILRHISESNRLVQLMDIVGNINHTVIIFGYWIFYNNYKKALLLTLDLLNLICPALVGEGMFAVFESVFRAFRYISITGKLNMSDFWRTVLYEEIKVECELDYGIITDVTCIYIYSKTIYNRYIDEINKWLKTGMNYNLSPSSLEFISKSIFYLCWFYSRIKSWSDSVRHEGYFR